MMLKDVHIPAWAALSAMSIIAPGWVEEQARAEQAMQMLCAITGKTADEILAFCHQHLLDLVEFEMNILGR